VAPGRVQNGYVSSSTSGHARPLRELKNRPVSSEHVPSRALEWTRVRYSSFPRNEGVRGSSPRVGLSSRGNPCITRFCVASAGAECTSPGMKGSAAQVRASPCKWAGFLLQSPVTAAVTSRHEGCTGGFRAGSAQAGALRGFLIVELIEPRRGTGIVIDRGFHELRYGERGRRTLERTAVRRGGAPSGLIVPIKLGACRLVLASLSVPRAAVKS